MFQPVIPLGGTGGWRFLQATYDRQLQSHSQSPQIRLDSEYLTQKLSEPLSVDDFLSDRRLLRISLTSFDLGGEEWKRGFIDKVLTESSDAESTFLARLNNPKYTKFSEAFSPTNGMISLTPQRVSQMATQYEAAAFEASVGEVDDTMRLSLNYQSEIGAIVNSGSSETTILYRLLGDVPVRRLLEGATNLPAEIQKLPIERQADLLKERLQNTLGIRGLSQLAEPANIERMISRFHALDAVKQGVSANSPTSVALSILSSASGLGSLASQNLFLSRF